MASSQSEVRLNIRMMETSDVLPIATWMMNVPLWKRYRLTVDKIVRQFNDAIAQSDPIFAVERYSTDPLIGFAWLKSKGMFGKSPYLKQIGIHPDYTGVGIGHMLLSYVENYCQQIASDLFLLVSDFNIEAQRFYKQQGYQHIGAIPNYVLPDVTEYIYFKAFKESDGPI